MMKYKNFSEAIVAENCTLPQSEAEVIFREFYSNHQFTDCLEILEEQGFWEEAAIFLLSFLGGEG